MIDFEGKSWRDELIGTTFDERLSEKIIEARLREARINHERLPDMSMVAALNSRTKEIKSIGFNKPGDLILNNFGIFLSGIFLPYWQPWTQTLKNISNVNISVNFTDIGQYCYCWNRNFNGTFGTYMQLGSSTSTPARADYTIGTAFATYPESDKFWTSPGVYSPVGYVSVAGAIVAGGSGTINEAILGMYIGVGSSGNEYTAFVHDAINPGVSFVAGDTLCERVVFTL